MKDVINKLKTIFNETIKKGPDYNGLLKKINYFTIQYLHDKIKGIHEIGGFNVSMYRCKYLNHDSILMLFAIPISSDIDKRHLNDRVMDIMRYCENTFITLEYRHLEKDGLVMYFICIKVIDEKENLKIWK